MAEKKKKQQQKPISSPAAHTTWIGRKLCSLWSPGVQEGQGPMAALAFRIPKEEKGERCKKLFYDGSKIQVVFFKQVLAALPHTDNETLLPGCETHDFCGKDQELQSHQMLGKRRTRISRKSYSDSHWTLGLWTLWTPFCNVHTSHWQIWVDFYSQRPNSEEMLTSHQPELSLLSPWISRLPCPYEDSQCFVISEFPPLSKRAKKLWRWWNLRFSLRCLRLEGPRVPLSSISSGTWSAGKDESNQWFGGIWVTWYI